MTSSVLSLLGFYDSYVSLTRCSYYKATDIWKNDF